MAGVTDQHHVASGPAMPDNLHVHLGHQRAGGVEYAQTAFAAGVANRPRYAVRAENDRGAVRHLVQFVDEHGARAAQAVDHEAVVHHLVAHVDRSAEALERTLHDLGGDPDKLILHPGTRSPEIRQARLAVDGHPHIRQNLQRGPRRQFVTGRDRVPIGLNDGTCFDHDVLFRSVDPVR